MNAASRPLVGVVAALAVAAAACGSSTSKSSPQGAASSGGQSASSAGAPTSAGPTVDANELTALAKAAAGKAGAPVKVPPKTIGYLRYVAAAPADQRVYEAAVAAAAVLGWKVIPCDGAGDPTKLAACGNTLLNQKIDALLDDGVPPSIIATSLARAKAAGIPTLYSGGTVDNAASYSAGYVPPDGQMGEVLANYVTSQLKGKSGGVIVQGFPTSWGIQRVDALKTAAKAANISIDSQQDADGTNLVAGTQAQMAAQLNAHPNAKGMWITFETAVIGAAQAVQAKSPGKKFPQRPLLVTFYANLPTIQLIRAGKVDAAIEDSLEWSSWVAMDQMAEFFARKTPFAKDVRPDYGKGLDFWRPTLVTKDNAPSEGQLVTPPVDFTTFFKAKWKTEFNAAG